MTDPKQDVHDIIFGRWRSQILYAGAKLGVFDLLGGGAKKAENIAKELGLDRSMSYRLLRALGSLKLLDEDGDRIFSLAPAGEFLRKDHPETLQGVALLAEGPEHYALWKHLPAMIRDGRQNAFLREFGEMPFDYAARNAEYDETFNDAMSSQSQRETAWVLEALEPYDFTKISHLCDVGGGHGYLLCSILARNPNLKGTVLELANVITDEDLLWANRMEVGERCHYVAGDMFQEVPAADAYILKHIAHDWSDNECAQFFSNIYEAAPTGARILIAEYIIPRPDTSSFGKLYDVHMMCWGTGKERTEEEYAAVLEGAGWKFERTWFPPSKEMGVVEGIKV